MRIAKILFIFCIMCLTTSTLFSARIKDLTKIEGVRDNQLVGYGLVVGLDGTGDKTAQTPFTDQSFRNMLQQFGIKMPDGKTSQLKNVAAVAISATLPPFARIGQKIDVTVLSIGNATSLRGGSLLMTQLQGADGKIYAVSQGSVMVAGFGAQGADGSKVVVNVTSSGSIPDGATVENTLATPFVQNGAVTFELLQPDFTSAELVERAINETFHHHVATALDASAIRVKIAALDRYEREHYTRSRIVSSHDQYKGDDFEKEEIVSEDAHNDEAIMSRYVPIISRIENITLTPAEIGARVVVNSRTGTIVIGENVTVSPVAVSHGNLSVIITEKPVISQPGAFSNGRTVSTKASQVSVSQQANRAFLFAPGPSLNDLVDAIDQVGAAPGDLIAILEAIKASGALHADLEVL